jgi:AraC-like DNA-binding protein
MDILAFFIYFFAMPSGAFAKPLPAPRILSLLFSQKRDAFTHAVETYRHWTILGLKSGRFRYSFGPASGKVCEAGEFLVCPPGVALHRAALEPLRFYFIAFAWSVKPGPPWQGKHGLVDLARLESTLGHLEKLQEQALAPEERAWAGHLVLDLLRQRLHERRGERKTERPPDGRMIRLADRMRQELDRPFNLDEAAAQMRLTPSQLSRRFQAAFGSNPALYRTRLRMQEARRLLRETTLGLEEIAIACGYENAFYFSRVFRAQNGLPPSQFRKNLRV